MARIFQILSAAAVAFFCYAQMTGLTTERFFHGSNAGNNFARSSYHK